MLLMDRRKFLGWVPAVAAAPLIGTELIRGNNEIILVNPSPITDVAGRPIRSGFNVMDCRLQVVDNQTNEIIGEGVIHQLSIHQPAFRMYEGVPKTIAIEGSLMYLNKI